MKISAILRLFGRGVSVATGVVCLFGILMEADASVEYSQPVAVVVNINFDGGSIPKTSGECEIKPNDVVVFAGGPYSTDGQPTSMNARFTPTDDAGRPVALQAASSNCGFRFFNWKQTITRWPRPSALVSRDPIRFQQALGYAPPSAFTAPSPYPFPDPPPGGYTYFTSLGHTGWDSYPFFYDPKSNGNSWSLAEHETANTLSFFDAPSNSCLVGGTGQGCNGIVAEPSSDLRFTTTLVGVREDSSVVDLYRWDWISTFNGTTGGISAITGRLAAVDSSRHRFIASINGVPQTPPRVTCAATPNTLLPTNGESVTVRVSGRVTPGSSPIPAAGATYDVTDAHKLLQPTGNIALGREGSYSFSVPMTVVRTGNEQDGRTYTIRVTATDNMGNSSSCFTLIKTSITNAGLH